MKIYLFYDSGDVIGDVIGYAIGEDGKGLASHLSSDIQWSKHDMGLTSNWKHDIYSNAYPDGWELEWVDDPESHTGLQASLKLNETTSDKGNTTSQDIGF